MESHQKVHGLLALPSQKQEFLIALVAAEHAEFNPVHGHGDEPVGAGSGRADVQIGTDTVMGTDIFPVT